MSRFTSLAALGLAVACGAPPDEGPKTADTGKTAEEKASSKKAQGIQMIRSKSYESARSLLESAAKDDPSDAEVHHYLGVAEEQLGNKEAARAAYQKALELNPKLLEAALNLSALFLDAEEYEAAVKAADQGLAVDQTHGGLQMNKAQALEQLGRADDAVVAYKAAVDARPDDDRLRFAYAELLLKTDQGDKALEQLKKLKTTDDVDVLFMSSKHFAKVKSFGDCVDVLDRAIEKNPVVDFYVSRGLCRFGAKEYPKARSDFEKSLEINESSAPAHYWLGVLSLTEKKTDEALEHLNKAAELDKGGHFGTKAKEMAAKIKK